MQLNTITWGGGPRSALLLHGVTSNAAGWWRLGPVVADLGYTVVAADLRGHGESPKSEDHLLSSHASDVAALRPAWDVVLGHSMGGAVAVVAASQNPSWARTLILEDPAIVFVDLTFAIAWLLTAFSGDISADRLAAENPQWPPRDAETKAQALLQCGPQAVERAFTQNDPWDLRDAVAGLRVPTTIIGAAPGHSLIPPELGDELTANPEVSLVRVPGSHSMHRDRWDDFWAVVRPLL
jgi:pimeloyl-ACP methyl ester carboxylesterase